MSKAPRDAEPKIRRGRRRLLGVLLLILVLGLIIGGTLAQYRLEPWLRAKLERDLSRALKGQVVVAQVELNPLRGELVFRGVEFVGPGDPARVHLVLPGGRARIGLKSLTALRGRGVHLSEVVLDRPRVSTSPRPPGTPRPPTRSSGSVDLRIDRLVIREGVWIHGGVGTPFEVEAREVEVGAAWSDGLDALLGRITAKVRVAGKNGTEPLLLDGRGTLRMRGNAVELKGVVLEGPSLDVELDGRVDLSGAPTFRASGFFRGRLEILRKLLGRGVPEASGMADGTLRLRVGSGPLSVEGSLRLRQPRFARISAETLEAGYRYTESRLALFDVSAEMGGGHVEGAVELRLGGGAVEYGIEAQGNGLSSTALLSWVNLDLPLASTVDGQITLSGRGGAPELLAARGRFEARRADEQNRLPARGRGLVELESRRLHVSVEELETAALRADLEMTLTLGQRPLGGTVKVAGRSEDYATTLAGVERLLENLGPTLPEVARRPLEGSGPVDALVELGEAPSVRLWMSSGPGRWDRQRFDRATVDLAVLLGEKRILLHDLDLARGSQSITGSLRWRWEPASLESADLQVAETQIGPLFDMLGLPPGIEGRLSGDLRFDGSQGGGRLEVHGISAWGERLDQLTATFEGGDGRLRTNDLEIRGPAIEIAADAEWDPLTSAGRLDLRKALVDLPRTEIVRRRAALLAGTLEITGEVGFGRSTLDGRLELAGRDLALGPVRLGDARGTGVLSSERLQLEVSRADGDSWSGSLGLGLAPPFQIDGSVELRDVAIDLSDGATFRRLLARGTLELSGPLERPDELAVTGGLEGSALELGVHRLEATSRFPVRLTAGRIGFGPVTWTGAATDLVSEIELDIGSGELRGGLRGSLDLALVDVPLPEFRAAGAAEVDLSIRGSLERPEAHGSVHLSGGRLRWLGFPRTLEQIEMNAVLEGRTARIENLRALFGGGEVRGNGTAEVIDEGGLEYRLEAFASGVHMEWPEDFEALYDARLTLEGSQTRATLGGTVQVLRGRYTSEFDLTRLLGASRRGYVSAPTPGFDLGFDLRLLAEEDVWVRNDLAKIEMRFDLHLGGSLERPELTGRLGLLEGGLLWFQDVEYRIASGSLDFADPDRINPFLQLRAETTVAQHDVRLHVQGTPESIDYQLTSNPALSQQDIIVLLSTGRTPDERTRDDSGTEFTGDLAANYFAGALTAPFERQLRRVLGLDRVEINPLLIYGEADPTTRVTLGKRVSERVSVVYSTDLGREERQLYRIEWQANRKLILAASDETFRGIGADVGWRSRYYWTRDQVDAPSPWSGDQTVFDEERVAQTVAAVRIEGLDAQDDEDLVERLPIAVGQSFTRSAMFAGAESLKRQFIGQGRIEARVEARSIDLSAEEVEVVYRIDPGTRVEVAIEGASRKEQRRLKRDLEEVWAESLFQSGLYADAARRIEKAFRERGFFTVYVSYREEELDGERRVTFTVDRGREVRVRAVTVEGAAQLGEERIRKQILTRPASIFSKRLLFPETLRDDLAAIRSLYRDEGLLDVEIEQPQIRLSADASEATVLVRIDEGPLYVVGSVEFEGPSPFGLRLLEQWAGLRPGETFSRRRVLEAESGLRAGLDGEGYPDAEVRGSVSFDETRAEVVFAVEPGARLRVAEVVVEGNLLTRERVIRRELGIESGDFISREALLQGQHRLYRLGLFDSVRLDYSPADPGNPTEQRLLVRVHESRPLGVNVLAGYDSEAGPRVNVALTNENVTGRDRVISLQGYYSGILRRIQMVGEEPRLFGRRYPTLISFAWEEQEFTGFTVERRSTAIRVNHDINRRWGGFARYNFQRVDLFDVSDPTEPPKQRLQDLRLGDIGLAIIRGTLDDPITPSRGAVVSLQSNLFAKPLLSEATFFRTLLKGLWLAPFHRGPTVAVGLRVGLAWPYGDTLVVPLPERFFAGGANSIRGFERDSVGPMVGGIAVGGQSLFVLNTELWVPVWRTVQGVVFLDQGNVFATVSDFDLSELRESAGLGARYMTPIGPLRAEYAWKLDREEGETPGEWHFSVGIPF